MSNDLLKLYKQKQKLHENFLKKKTPRNESIYKSYKSLFESLKKMPKKNYYTRRLGNYQKDIKKSRDAIKEIIEGAKSTEGIFPKIMIIDGQEIFDQGKTANYFNKFSVDIGPKLHQTFMGEANVTDGEVKETLRSLNLTKVQGMTIFLRIW